MNKMMPVDPVNPDPLILAEAATVIREGGLVAYPTDTCYGIAVDPFNETAVKRLFRAKKRSFDKPILLLVSNVQQLRSLVCDISYLAEALIEAFWPGPLTVLFQSASHISPFLTSGTGKIGLRIPDAALPIHLMGASGFPLTATSANVSGESSPVRAQEVAKMMGNEIDIILDGGICGTRPSTIVDLGDGVPEILRAGKVSGHRLKSFFSALGVQLIGDLSEQ